MTADVHLDTIVTVLGHSNVVEESLLEARGTVDIGVASVQLVCCVLVASITMPLAFSVGFVHHHQARCCSTKELTAELASQWRPEPTLVGVLCAGALSKNAHAHGASELCSILGMEVRSLCGTAQAVHIDTILHGCYRPAANTIQERAVVAHSERRLFLLTTEGDLDN